ncbi:hypothetical protein O9929_17180 [Vibrio lentus]|nr:hypothetical protein [Vibrio lentus]
MHVRAGRVRSLLSGSQDQATTLETIRLAIAQHPLITSCWNVESYLIFQSVPLLTSLDRVSNETYKKSLKAADDALYQQRGG